MEQLDPGNADPEAWAVPLTDDELADVLARVDNPDPTVTAGLAGTLYDPEYTGPGDEGPAGELDQEVSPDGN
jgi:hypothetical protein